MPVAVGEGPWRVCTCVCVCVCVRERERLEWVCVYVCICVHVSVWLGGVSCEGVCDCVAVWGARQESLQVSLFVSQCVNAGVREVPCVLWEALRVRVSVCAHVCVCWVCLRMCLGVCVCAHLCV